MVVVPVTVTSACDRLTHPVVTTQAAMETAATVHLKVMSIPPVYWTLSISFRTCCSYSFCDIALLSLAFFRSISCWPIDTLTVGGITSVFADEHAASAHRATTAAPLAKNLAIKPSRLVALRSMLANVPPPICRRRAPAGCTAGIAAGALSMHVGSAIRPTSPIANG
jgi:hypothetical protein